MAQRFATPEAAISEYLESYKLRDVERFIASIDLEREAAERLSRGPNKVDIPSVTHVNEKAASLALELRQHFAKFGFKSAALDNCDVVRKFEDAPTLVRVVLNCADARGSTFVPIRVLQTPSGWKVVRG